MASVDEKADLKKDLKEQEANDSAVPAFNQDTENQEVKYPYPKSIAFIVSNEFCERFSFYGMRTVLSLYLNQKLRYDVDTSVVIYHVFIMFVYFFPIFGAMIADSWLGRFKTIIYLSIVYAIGNVLVAVTAIPTTGIPDRAFTIIGLLLVAIGTGGIKPCVSAFGGDQFRLPQQEKQLATFFSLFYFAINAGSFISTFVTPILRVDVHCFGDEDCYSLAFGVPGILMIVSIFIFIAGKSLYIIKKPSGNVLLNVMKCIKHALSRRGKLKKTEKKEHWLDYADDKYSQDEINGIKAVLKVLFLFIPLPVFWALFDQQGSRWTFQATRMDGMIGDFTLQPDQMQVVNPILILVMIPLFEIAIYPALNWCRLVRKPLHKMILGGMLAAAAFIISGVVELELQTTYPVLPKIDNAHLRVFNGYNCEVNLMSPNLSGGDSIIIPPLGMYEDKTLFAQGKRNISYTITPKVLNQCENWQVPPEGEFEIRELTAMSYFINGDSVTGMVDSSDKTEKGLPAVSVLRAFSSEEDVVYRDTKSGKETNIKFNNTERNILTPSMYSVRIGNKELTDEDIALRLGAVFTMVVNEAGIEPVYNISIITPENSMHMMWLLPQYIIITMGEVMFSVTGLEFAFTQAPLSLKSVLTAGWLLTVAFGNLIVIIVAEAQSFESQASEFFLFAGLMVVDMIIFWIMTLSYKYVDNINSEKQEKPPSLPMTEDVVPAKEGIDNLGLKLEE